MSLQEWPSSTNIKCWYCGLGFKSHPIFIPKSINNTNKGKSLSVCGNFCTFGCAQAFIETNKMISNTFDSIGHLKYLYNIFYEKKINDIISSPNKYNLLQYGGTLTIKEYKNKLIEINNKNLNNGY